MEKISDRLKQVLTMRDMTAAELARRSGVDKGSISNYLKGKFMPKQSAIGSMARALGVSPAWLMGYDVKMDKVYDEQPNELNVLIESLTADEARDVKAYIDFVLSRRNKQ